MEKIDLLRPKVRQLAKELIDLCKESGYEIRVVETLRSIEEQDKLYAKGRTQPGEIVTNAKGGMSFHNYGVAFDICPIINGEFAWNRNDLFQIIGDIGTSLGLEWGGSWKGSWDKPHFEYSGGYKIEDFFNGRVDWTKFDTMAGNPPINESVPSVSVFSISRSLGYKMAGDDVKLLQQILNMDPDTQVATEGDGSPGHETKFFGALTEKAVQKFQVKHEIVQEGNPHTTGYGLVGPRTREALERVFKERLTRINP